MGHVQLSKIVRVPISILISTGDLSGDFIGSLLVKELKRLAPETTFYAVGGEHLKNAGAKLLEDSSKWSAIGIFDALSKVPSVYSAYRRLKKSIPAMNLSGVVYLDCPAFNLLLSKSIFSLKIPSVYFFPPSSWRNDPARAARVGKRVNRVIAPFKQTESLYKKAGVPTFFSGHPLLDRIPSTGNKENAARELRLDPKRPIVGLFPGSRTQEIKYLLPILLKAANDLYLEDPSVQFALAIAHPSLEEEITRKVKSANAPVVMRHQSNYTIMQASDVLLIASGTATLEAALHEKPMVIVYKVSEWSWRLEAPFLKGIAFAGLPNLLAGKEIAPEFLQEKATAKNVGDKMRELLDSPALRESMIRELKCIRPSLGEPGAIPRAAKAILETFHG